VRSIAVYGLMCLFLGVQAWGGEGVREGNGDNDYSPCPPTWARRFALTMRYKISAGGKTSKATVTCLIPRSLDRRQEVREIDYSPKPERVFSANGSRYAQFVFIKPKGRIYIEVKAVVDTYRYDLTVAECKDEPGKSAIDSELEKYLVSERFIESNDEKIKMAAMLIEGGDEVVGIKNVFDFVTEHTKYDGYIADAQGAKETFESGRGDCTDYTDLLVALCRAKGIPARHVTGLTAFAADTPKHSWAEIYTKRLGWVPFDPMQADLKKPAYDFDKLRNRHIYLSSIRNDPTLMGKYTFWYYKYWGNPISATDTYEVVKLDSRNPW